MSRPSHIDRGLLRAVAERVRQARRRKDWSQEKLAEALGVQPETVSRYETGSVPLSLSMLFKVAEVLCTDAGTLLGLRTRMAEEEDAKDEDDLVLTWRMLDDESRSLILQLVRKLRG